jgi:hypothetical protein
MARERNVVIEFKDYDTVIACYHSTEYATAKAVREPISISNVPIIERYNGPEPESHPTLHELNRVQFETDSRALGCAASCSHIANFP